MPATFPLMAVCRHRLDRDGEGVTTLVAAFGCRLRCAYCLNHWCFHTPRASRMVTPEELLERVRIDDLYFQATDGGITFGGGEPLLQAAFIEEFRAVAPPSWRIHAETCLNVPRDDVRRALGCVDSLIVDVKDMDPAIYRAYTGQANEAVRRNLELVLASGVPYRVKVPLIGGFNTPADIDRSVSALVAMGCDPARIQTVVYDTTRGERGVEDEG